VNAPNSAPESCAGCAKDGECGKNAEAELSGGETRVELIALDFLGQACRRRRLLQRLRVSMNAQTNEGRGEKEGGKGRKKT
jgi:hypothetical protein